MSNIVFTPEACGLELTLRAQREGIVEMSLAGPVTQAELERTYDPLREALGANPFREDVVLDMSEVSSLDTKGINWLLACHRRVRDAGGRLVLHSLSPASRNHIKVLNLQSVFNIGDDRNDAMSLLTDESVQPLGKGP